MKRFLPLSAKNHIFSNSVDGPAQSSSPLKRKIRVLLLEDEAADADLVVQALGEGGFDLEWIRVETEQEFKEQLDPAVDVILADYNLPQFDGLQALQKLQDRGLDIPFIIVTGALGDERAAHCIKRGVTDYLLKDRLGRLGLAVSHALDERQLRAERKTLDEQLRQAQKMEAIGQLAGGIAHDFSNMLTVINGWSGMLLEDPAHSSDTREALKLIYTAGERAASLTRQLLVFSQRLPIRRIPLDLNRAIEDVTTMLRRLIGEDIDLTLKLAPDLPHVEADVGMMEQVLMNLAVNSRDAMPRGGRLTVTTYAVIVSEAEASKRPEAKPGPHVALTVHDTGTGIAPEILPRIFEPFFTTKEVGKGTGLGLATFFSIVKQHHGWIEVDTEVGAGTTFRVLLPHAASRAASPEPPEPEEIAKGGRETILIVEDEPSVREYAVAVLQPQGYRVLQASSGLDALEVWRWHSRRINLLLTDMVMPDDVTGPELAARLLADKPALAVIFTSGYTQEMTCAVFGADETTHFLHKPYTPRVLTKMVRQLLDQKAKSATVAAPSP